MSYEIWWNGLCGNQSEDDAFWSSELTLNTSDPDLTQCFQTTVITWLPCGLLWLASVFYLPHLYRQATVNTVYSTSPFNVFKTVLCLLLSGVALCDLTYTLVYHIRYSDEVPAKFIQTSLYIITYLLAAILTHYEFRKGVHSAGVLCIFWTLSVFLDIIPFRSYIRQVDYDELGFTVIDDMARFTLFYISYTLIFIQFFCCLFSDLRALPWLQQTQHVWKAGEKQPLLVENRHNMKKQHFNTCPVTTASYWSRVLFIWPFGMIKKAYKQKLEFKDLWELLPTHKCEDIMQKVMHVWEQEISSKRFRMIVNKTMEQNCNGSLPEKSWRITGNPATRNESTTKTPPASTPKSGPDPSLMKVIVKVFGPYFLLGSTCFMVSTLLSFISPQILSLLITYVSDANAYQWQGYVYVILLAMIAQLRSFFYQNHWNYNTLSGMKLRTAVIGLVYRKSLKLNSSARIKSTVGEIVNLMSVDAQKLQDMCLYLNFVWNAPVTIAIALYFLWLELGPSAIAGFFVMVLMIPINAFVSFKAKQLQTTQMKEKDNRIKLMTEILNGIKVLKMYAWEKSFRDRILSIRRKELDMLIKSLFYLASNDIGFFMSPYLVALGSFAAYTLSSPSNILDANKAFVSLSLFNIMNLSLSILPLAVISGIQAYVSVGRINNFLKNEELDPNNVTEANVKTGSISIENGRFSWNRKQCAILTDLTIQIPDGKLVAVVGPVGCGKSSLLSAILGEMEVIDGIVRRKGSVAYVPQQAWIQNNTMQQNIIFGKPMKKVIYKNVLDICALKPDLKILPGGDQIEIGEKGINLSGGQKQRVSLARAVYQNSDIYLLDDPLSAVDAHVGKHIFEHVIGPNGILKHKTRIMVTNSATFLPNADVIISLQNGHILEMGSYADLVNHKGQFAEFIDTYLKETSPESGSAEDAGFSTDGSESMSAESGPISRSSSVIQQRQTSRKRLFSRQTSSVYTDTDHIKREEKRHRDKRLTEAESTLEGTIKLSVLVSWFRSCGLVSSITVVCTYVMYMVSQTVANIWLSEWSNDPPTLNGTQDLGQRNMRLEVYGAIGAVQAISVFGQTIAMAFATVRSSRVLHERLLANILRAPMSFFDTVPMGRIINRFSKDVDILDITIPAVLKVFLVSMAIILTTLFVISYSNPIFIAVAIPVFIFYILSQRFYVTTTRQLKRIESVSRSPVFAHFSETLTGTSSVRAYMKQVAFIQKSNQLVDENQMAYYPNIIVNRCLGICLDFSGTVVVLFAGVFAVIEKGVISASLAGLSVSYALQLTGIMNVWVRNMSELENSVVAVERIEEYIDCPKEAPEVVAGNTPPQDWPAEGRVDITHYSTRYRPGLDLVLQDMSCSIKPGEQLGIVGRTGAGKSSITLALFRIIEAAAGNITIDGVNIHMIGLRDLRSRITIIPQDPVLFSGSLRMNLDPFDQHRDTEVWKALKQAHMRDYVMTLPENLGYMCGEGGENLRFVKGKLFLSVGQRQLVCLARALLRKSKILVLDEATAAIDLETDDLIQKTIRSEFQGSTVITVAHRLNTIMDYHRIMVLDKGRIVEMDTPNELLKNNRSLFYSMANNAGLL